MKIIFTGLLSFFIWASGSSYFYVCKIKHKCPTEDCVDCDEENAVALAEPVTPAPAEEEAIPEEPAVEEPVEEEASGPSAKTLEAVAFLESGHIQFEFTKTEMINNEANKNFMGKLTSFLKENPDYTTVITGNTCDKGELNVNQKIGKQRANYIAKVLMRSGIEKSRIETLSEGETKPLVPNSNEEARIKNRRVDIILR